MENKKIKFSNNISNSSLHFLLILFLLIIFPNVKPAESASASASAWPSTRERASANAITLDKLASFDEKLWPKVLDLTVKLDEFNNLREDFEKSLLKFSLKPLKFSFLEIIRQEFSDSRQEFSDSILLLLQHHLLEHVTNGIYHLLEHVTNGIYAINDVIITLNNDEIIVQKTENGTITKKIELNENEIIIEKYKNKKLIQRIKNGQGEIVVTDSSPAMTIIKKIKNNSVEIVKFRDNEQTTIIYKKTENSEGTIETITTEETRGEITTGETRGEEETTDSRIQTTTLTTSKDKKTVKHETKENGLINGINIINGIKTYLLEVDSEGQIKKEYEQNGRYDGRHKVLSLSEKQYIFDHVVGGHVLGHVLFSQFSYFENGARNNKILKIEIDLTTNNISTSVLNPVAVADVVEEMIMEDRMIQMERINQINRKRNRIVLVKLDLGRNFLDHLGRNFRMMTMDLNQLTNPMNPTMSQLKLMIQLKEDSMNQLTNSMNQLTMNQLTMNPMTEHIKIGDQFEIP